VPEAPAAAAGVVIGIGGTAAGLVYVAAGIAQDHLGLVPTMIVTFVL
jgi:FSR family fosmidomycin resistance protein-like MFS transporter